MRSAVPIYLVAMFFEAGACGTVKANDAGVDSQVPLGDAQVPLGDAQVPLGDAPVSDAPAPVNCDFAAAGGICVFPPHIPVDSLRTCFATSATAPALVPPTNATLTFRKVGASYQLDCSPDCGGSTTTITSQPPIDQADAPPVAVFCLSTASIPRDVSVKADPSFDRAITLLASGVITIGGTLEFSGRQDADGQGGPGGPGGYAGGGGSSVKGAGPCGGAGGITQAGNPATIGGGGGGGGHAGTGGSGGAGNPGPGPGPGGGDGGCSASYGKLRGGSGGGAGGSGTPTFSGNPQPDRNVAGSGGGGAVALVSRTSLSVTGTIIARGASGRNDPKDTRTNLDALGGSGGGAGGAIVLASRIVDVTGSLHVEGGDGSVAWGSGGPGAQGANVDGSAGANGPNSSNGGAGGGGSGGYVRIFSAAGVADCATIASPAVGCGNRSLLTTPGA